MTTHCTIPSTYYLVFSTYLLPRYLLQPATSHQTQSKSLIDMGALGVSWHAKWTTRCSPSIETLMSVDLCNVRQLIIEILHRGEWMAKPITVLRKSVQKKHFSPHRFSWIPAASRKKRIFAQKKHWVASTYYG